MGWQYRRHFALTLAATLFWTNWAGAQSPDETRLSDAQAAYDAGNFQLAFSKFEPLALAGDKVAQFYVGLMNDEGEGVPVDDAEGVKWYRLSAAQGYPRAQLNLGLMLSEGEGVTEDDKEALQWIRKASDTLNSDAQYWMGHFYITGEGIEQDTSEALRWFGLSADQGDVDAMYRLGTIYDFGEGVVDDDVEAVRWYRLSAERGNPKAQHFLGLSYFLGEGVPKNAMEAYFWLSLAAEKDPEISGDRNEAQDGLTSMQLVRVASRVERWKPVAGAVGTDLSTSGKSDALRSAETEKPDALYRTVQSGLGLLGYYSGDADGIPDQAVRRAVSAFKNEVGLDDNDEVTPDLAFYLGAAAGISASKTLSESAESGSVAGSGSGFVVSRAGYIVTAAHVVEKCASVTLSEGEVLSIESLDSDLDLAVLKTEKPWTQPTLALRSGQDIFLGETVMVAGFPLKGIVTSELNVTTGNVSALSGPGEDNKVFQMTAPSQVGNSGGPVIDLAGNVIGVVVSKLDAMEVQSEAGDLPQNINFAVSLRTLRYFLDSRGIQYEERRSSKAKKDVQTAQDARIATVRLECRD